MRRICIIAAVARNRVIGKGNGLLWHIPEDMKHFREITRGKPVIMGRKTWESLPEKFRPLPGRQNIVLTRDKRYVAAGALIAGSLDEAMQMADAAPEVFIIGGAEIYRQALPLADCLYLTEVDVTPEGDAFFPEIDPMVWGVVERGEGVPASTPQYAFITYRKSDVRS